MRNSNFSYCNIINAFHNKHILVVGDLILDVYLNGTSTRLSPEAPVPVVDIKERKAMLGGAANTVCNLRTLGARVTYCTIIGTDSEGDEANNLLNDIGVDTQSVIPCPERRTLVKTRVVAGGHVITRFDAGTQLPADESSCQRLIQFIQNTYEQYDALIFSDYDKGTITAGLISAVNQLRHGRQKFIAVDSKRLPFFAELRPSLVKPNYDEAVKLFSTDVMFSGRVEQITSGRKILFEKTGASLIAVTLDHEGSLFFKNGEMIYRAHAPAIEVPHVAGAGDTFLSAFTLAYISSMEIAASAEISNAAAAIAVRKEATSACTNGELKCYFHIQNKRIDALTELEQLCKNYRSQGKRIVFTNGCFDILHSGHVTYLHCAKELGDVLIVGINHDESIQRIKGKDRPINTLSDRIDVLSGLSAVDHLVPFGNQEDDTPIPLIKVICPDVFVKGGDYSKDKLPEADTVESNGGKIVFLPFIPDHSTTSIIQKINTFTSKKKKLKTVGHE
jgi:D-beta-D-heptose 7-phosphate kinase/D-beta-D-heptose 1-phosphate adenosyltransferase